MNHFCALVTISTNHYEDFDKIIGTPNTRFSVHISHEDWVFAFGYASEDFKNGNLYKGSYAARDKKIDIMSGIRLLYQVYKYHRIYMS